MFGRLKVELVSGLAILVFALVECPSPTAYASSAGTLAGPKAVMGTFMEKVFSDYGAEDKAMTDEVASLNIFEVLQPNWLASKPDFEEGHARIQKARDIYSRYLARVAQRRVDVVTGIHKLSLSKNDQADMERGFTRSFDAEGVERTKSRDLTFALLDEMDSTLTFLNDTKSNWVIKDGKVLFSKPADLPIFQGHVEQFRTSLAAVAQNSKEMAELKEQKHQEGEKLVH